MSPTCQALCEVPRTHYLILLNLHSSSNNFEGTWHFSEMGFLQSSGSQDEQHQQKLTHWVGEPSCWKREHHPSPSSSYSPSTSTLSGTPQHLPANTSLGHPAERRAPRQLLLEVSVRTWTPGTNEHCLRATRGSLPLPLSWACPSFTRKHFKNTALREKCGVKIIWMVLKLR